MKSRLKQLIADGKTEETIQELLRLSEEMDDKELQEDAIMQSSRYTQYAKQQRQGTVSTEDQSIALARINFALIQISDRLPATGGSAARRLNSIPGIDSRDVVGRAEDLARLRAELESAASLLLMNGIGGIGKTTLAKLYAHVYGDGYDRLAWVEQRESLAQAIAGDLGLQHSLNIHPEPGEGSEATCYRMLLALQNMDGKNLLILDNVDASIRDIKDQLPNGKHWHVLLTSRQLIGSYEWMELSKLAPEPALALFQKHCQKPQDEAALQAFLQKIEYHTLSIELFAKTLDAHWGMDTVEEMAAYLDTMHLDDKTLQTIIEVEHAKGQTSLFRHLLHAFDLSGLDKRPELLLLLKQMAVLPPLAEGYPTKDLMTWLRIEEEKTTFANHLQELYRIGWLLQPRKNCFDSHRLIKTVVRYSRMPAKEDVLSLVNSFSQKLNFDRTKDNPADGFQWIPYGQSLLEAIEHLAFDQKASLQNNLAGALMDRGDLKAAKELLEKVLAYDEKTFGPDHPDTALSYNNLAQILADLGDYPGAMAFFEKAVVTREKNFGAEHPDTATSYNNLGNVLLQSGDYPGARAYIEKVVAIYEKNFGPDHPDTALSYNNLARILADLGDYPGARAFFEKAIAIDEKNFGAEHPSTATGYNNMGGVLRQTADYLGARALFEKALAINEKNFGPEHPDTARSYNNLAQVLGDLGDYASSRALFEKALAINEKNFGPEHPNVATIYNNLGLVLLQLGDYASSRALFEKALAINEKNFGPEHPDTATSYNNIGMALQKSGDYPGAREFCEKATAIWEKNFGPEHPDTATGYHSMGTVLLQLGDYPGAKEFFEKAIAVRGKNFGPEHPDTAKGYNNLSLLLLQSGDYPGAREFYEKAIAIWEINFGPEHPDTATGYVGLGVVLRQSRDYPQARHYLQKALAVYRECHGDEHPDTQTVVRLFKQLEALEQNRE